MSNANEQQWLSDLSAWQQRVQTGELMYDDAVGHDACGIGGIAAKDGKPTRLIIEQALEALVSLEHRGGIFGESGDGAGILLQIPRKLFDREIGKLSKVSLKADDKLVVGTFFVPFEPKNLMTELKAFVASEMRDAPVELLCWREVPTQPDKIGPESRASMPQIWQLFLKANIADSDLEYWTYRFRIRLEKGFLDRKWTGVYIPSLSHHMVSYKGLLTNPQLIAFYDDLRDPELETGMCIFHRRFSTNTFPNWALAQPFRMLAHNGEINTVSGNRQAVRAFAPQIIPDIDREHALAAGMSDSASLDQWLEHLVRHDHSALRALRISVPPSWNSEPEKWDKGAHDLFTYYTRAYGTLCAWDGPAGLMSTDGRYLIAGVDRMGLRPVRWSIDTKGNLFVSSESGTFGHKPNEIVLQGQLQPGEMIALDTKTGEFIDSKAFVAKVVEEAEAELGPIDELNASQILVPTAFGYSEIASAHSGDLEEKSGLELNQLLIAHGWDLDRVQFVKDMAQHGKEPLGSMGFDRVLSVLSNEHLTLFKYFQQIFAEVTNPPIDPYREGAAMDLTAYIGRRPRRRSEKNTLPPRQAELSIPVLTDAQVDELMQMEVLGPAVVPAVYDLNKGVEGFKAAVEELKSRVEQAVKAGNSVIFLSDRTAFIESADGSVPAPLPAIIALAVADGHLKKLALRDRCSLVVQSGEVQEGHDVCVLLGFGADAVHPYNILRLAYEGVIYRDKELKQDVNITPEEAVENVYHALDDILKKVYSKMGITTTNGYRDARLFEAVGLGADIAELIGPVVTRMGGIGIAELIEDNKDRWKRATELRELRKSMDYRMFNPIVRKAMQAAYETGSQDKFEKFADLVNSRPATLPRDLMRVRFDEAAQLIGPELQPTEVESAAEIISKRFRGAAMSHGALTREAVECIAIAMNELNARSNSGEGGEDRSRNKGGEKVHARSPTRQIASGRFGVDSEYLVNADEIQIKIAQGAKPGEGGQLMGKKVTVEIAKNRHAKPGTDLISPPPHHDIYSIEDLAQLIYDVKSIKPSLEVSVKLVAVHNIGTIAVGVAKAGADIIEIDGMSGGTGAALASSKEHTGLPVEMGLVEVHQALTINGMRHAVKLAVGGGNKTGLDIIRMAIMGGEMFVFGQTLMVAEGCVMCRTCHIPRCPTGVAGYQGPFKGEVEHVKNYLIQVATDANKLLAKLGAKRLDDIVGRTELLSKIDKPGRAGKLDFSRMLVNMPKSQAPSWGHTGEIARRTVQMKTESLNAKLAVACGDAIETGKDLQLSFAITNYDRSVGARIAGMIAERWKLEGMPNAGLISLKFRGHAGQSFGVWTMTGMELTLIGTAQDGVGKGQCGGIIVVRPDPDSAFDREWSSVVGNNVCFGATGGRCYIGGRAGQRLGIRNSGATIVAEGAGKYACEYMTEGRVVILGRTDNEIGSGMTGGEAILYDPEDNAPRRVHSKSVSFTSMTYQDFQWLRPLLGEYATMTDSERAKQILANWSECRRHFKKLIPIAEARKLESFVTSGANAG
ncbi:MAG TPA: glutamate synthase large subunit [Tepidisphaeraceae bacterium]|jgi:glutamate synthase domain-containing protein 2/glutamate synthase domain-containing protein 1/glutamate synthase domain-containing protein 3|nr:glutamate synthase large subunit [Tepidisphaeraceae bacterium]